MGTNILTAAQQQQMAAHLDKVRGILEAAEAKTAPGLLGGLLDSPELAQERGAVRQARELYTPWADDESTAGKRRWAEEGLRDDGTPYAFEDWMALGDTIAQGAAYSADQHYQSGYWQAAAASVAQDVTDVQQGAETAGAAVERGLETAQKAAAAVAAPWPLGVKVALGVGAAVAGLAGASVVARYVRAAKAFVGVGT